MLPLASPRALDVCGAIVRGLPVRAGCLDAVVLRRNAVQHGGSFRTEREARVRRDFLPGELAAGRNPADALHALVSPPKRPTVADVAAAWVESRVDVSEKTLDGYRIHRARIEKTLGDRDPHDLRLADVQEWIAANRDLSSGSLRLYLTTLRQILDHAGVEPNPARDRKVRLPRTEHAVVEPPGADDVEAIIGKTPKRWRLPLRVLEQTGLRVGELHELEWRDVDVASARFRVRSGKTAAARRWARCRNG